jgi:hypothetical protein
MPHETSEIFFLEKVLLRCAIGMSSWEKRISKILELAKCNKRCHLKIRRSGKF